MRRHRAVTVLVVHLERIDRLDVPDRGPGLTVPPRHTACAVLGGRPKVAADIEGRRVRPGTVVIEHRHGADQGLGSGQDRYPASYVAPSRAVPADEPDGCY